MKAIRERFTSHTKHHRTERVGGLACVCHSAAEGVTGGLGCNATWKCMSYLATVHGGANTSENGNAERSAQFGAGL